MDLAALFPERGEIRRDYDLDDEPERGIIAGLPTLARALERVAARIGPVYRQCDATALRLQKRHRQLATVCAVLGSSVVVFAILQLTFASLETLDAGSRLRWIV